MNSLGNARSAMNVASMQKYSDLLTEDARNALRKSQAYNVSAELQNAKDYYEQGLSSIQNGARQISQGCSVRNPTVRNAGKADLDKGKEYMERAFREMNTTFA
jgi:hypothetical protein